MTKNKTLLPSGDYWNSLFEYWPSSWIATMRDVFNDDTFPVTFDKLTKFPIDMYETNSNIVVEVACPGVKQEKWDIQLDKDILTIKAEKECEDKNQENVVYHKKSWFSQKSDLYTSLKLPVAVEGDSKAVYKDGILTVTLPKATPTAKTNKIKVDID